MLLSLMFMFWDFVRYRWCMFLRCFLVRWLNAFVVLSLQVLTAARLCLQLFALRNIWMYFSVPAPHPPCWELRDMWWNLACEHSVDTTDVNVTKSTIKLQSRSPIFVFQFDCDIKSSDCPHLWYSIKCYQVILSQIYIYTQDTCCHLLPSVLRAAPASMGMTSRGNIPLRPTATEPTRERNQTWACSLPKKSATAWRPGRISVRPCPGPAAVAVAWAIAVCDILCLLDAPLEVSISRVTGINRAATAQLGLRKLPPFIRPTVRRALATSNAVREVHFQADRPLLHLF